MSQDFWLGVFAGIGSVAALVAICVGYLMRVAASEPPAEEYQLLEFGP